MCGVWWAQVMGLLQVWVETTLIGWHVFVSACCLVIVTHRSAVKTLQQRLPLAVATAAGRRQDTPTLPHTQAAYP